MERNVAQTLRNATKTFPMRWLSLIIVGNTPIVIYAFRDRGKFERVGFFQNILWNLQNAGRALV